MPRAPTATSFVTPVPTPVDVSPVNVFPPDRPLDAIHGIKRSGLGSYASDLVSLTKPRILVLLLITTCCPMVLAAGGDVRLSQVLIALLGGALMSGSAGVINCIWDRDIDAVMERTKSRAMPNGRVSVSAALTFSGVLGTVGLAVLYYGLNPLAAALGLFGHLFYVFVYTIWLKRRTPQNIVIGGAAGAIPPMVGWVGVTGRLDLDAVLLFLVIFLWTPPHFWALALNRNSDYRRAGIPMLPVVAGRETTHQQMVAYAAALLPVTILLVWHNAALGAFSFVVLSCLGLTFLWKIVMLRRVPAGKDAEHEARAWDVFRFSVLYLALFFLCLVIDSLFI